jgi:uncharacterized DUF497 family protein
MIQGMNPDGLIITWESSKNDKNIKKHRVTFEEAKTVFYDEQARLIDDPDHSDSEDRFVLLGMSSKFRILLVCHCYRNDDEEIRIISARKAIGPEITNYTGGKHA